jgi:hypothetical protein
MSISSRTNSNDAVVVFHPELHDFREEIENSQDALRHQPYTSEKKKLMQYKSVFCFLGIIFSLLSLSIFFKSPNWYGYLIWGDIGLKSMINFVSIVLAGFCFFLAHYRKIEIELAYQIYSHARGRLRYIQRRKEIHIGLADDELLFNATRFLNHYSSEATYKMAQKRADTIFLLREIAYTSFDEASKREMLFNQALSEFKLSLDNIIAKFEQQV